MSELQVRFTFNDSLMEKYGIEKCSVYHTLKKHFEQRGLVCVSDDEVFLCSGKEKDYGSIWAILIALIKGNWLLKCAVSCEYIENGKSEDVLRQIPELRKLYKKIRKGIPENRAAIEAITLSDSITPRRQVYLRLSKQKLKKYYPRPNCSLNPRYYRKAWKDIENIMTAQGFECKNHSLYISTEPVTNAKVNIIINAVGKNLKWFPKCLTAIDVESVGEKRDLTGYFRKIKSISMNIRKMRIDDYEEVYGLWMSCAGMGLNNLDDSKAGIDKFLKRNPDTCFIAEVGNKLVGTIMVGNDGRRGYIYHTAVDPRYRRQKVASQLVDAAVEALALCGINKVALVVFDRNEKGNAFWEKLGFTVREDLVYRNKAIAEMVRIDT